MYVQCDCRLCVMCICSVCMVCKLWLFLGTAYMYVGTKLYCVYYILSFSVYKYMYCVYYVCSVLNSMSVVLCAVLMICICLCVCSMSKCVFKTHGDNE